MTYLTLLPAIFRHHLKISLFVPLMAVSAGCSSDQVPNSDTSSGGTSSSGGGGGALGSGGSNTGAGGSTTSVSGGSTGAGGDVASAGGNSSAGGNTQAGGSESGTGGAQGEVTAAGLVADMGVGTNIGNTLENTTSWETGWGQPLISQAYINGIASRGIKTVRVPVAWDTYAVNGVIDATKLARVKEVVGWIEAAGMYSIVNIHWDGGWIFNEGKTGAFQLTAEVKTKFASYWQQIAMGMSDIGHKLILEGINEEARYFVGGVENGTPDYAALNEINQLFVTTVRAQGGYNVSRALLIAGFQTDIALTAVDALIVPNDPAGTGKLFLSLHYYTPYTFCGLDTVESWGSPATTWGTADEKATLEGLFNTLGAFSVGKGVPIILGEFGVTLGENYPREPASRTLWMQSVAKACMSRGMVPVLWDTGSEISRTDGSFSTEFQAVMDSLH